MAGKGAHVALLRGINVGGRNKLPMKELAALFEAAGCERVQTYIQSGNVLFEAAAALAKQLDQVVGDAIERQYGFRPPLVMRRAADLRRITRQNPFLEAGVAPSELHVAFLAKRPTRAKLDDLDPHRSPPDSFEVVGKEIYLHCPKGIGKSKLTNAYFDAKLATVSTIRNWRTVLELLKRSQALR